MHPYLRYGFLIAAGGDLIPTRVIRHGVHFDFIAAMQNKNLSRAERHMLVEVLLDEVRASRKLHGLFLDRKRSRDRCRFLRRGLTVH